MKIIKIVMRAIVFTAFCAYSAQAMVAEVKEAESQVEFIELINNTFQQNNLDVFCDQLFVWFTNPETKDLAKEWLLELAAQSKNECFLYNSKKWLLMCDYSTQMYIITQLSSDRSLMDSAQDGDAEVLSMLLNHMPCSDNIINQVIDTAIAYQQPHILTTLFNHKQTQSITRNWIMSNSCVSIPNLYAIEKEGIFILYEACPEVMYSGYVVRELIMISSNKNSLFLDAIKSFSYENVAKLLKVTQFDQEALKEAINFAREKEQEKIVDLLTEYLTKWKQQQLAELENNMRQIRAILEENKREMQEE